MSQKINQTMEKLECKIGILIIPVRNNAECFFRQLPEFLDNTGFGYICIYFSAVIIIISIFGKVKDSYKWFILNQAIWDLLVSYDFICAKPFIVESKQFCVYSSFSEFINPIISAEAGYQLFLLSFSRFLALFFHNFYGRHSTSLKIIVLIGLYNILFIFLVNLKEIYSILKLNNLAIFRSLRFLQYVFKLLSIFSSFVFIILILYKIFKQLPFQLQLQDRAKTIASLRIASILMVNLIIIAIFFAFTSLYEFHYTIFPMFYSMVKNVPPRFQFTETIIILNGIKENQKCINVIRVLLDSIVILLVLSGYRKSILRIFEIFYKSKNATTTVTVFSNRRK